MNSRYLYYCLSGIIVLLFVGVIFGAYDANKLLASHAQLNLKAKSEALAQEQQSFIIARENIKKYSDLDEIARTVVPQDKNQAEAVREIVNLAAANHIALSSIDFPPSTLGGSSGASASIQGVPSAASSSSAANSPNSSQNKLSQLTQVKGIPGVYELPITISSDPNHPIQYNQLINFLSNLENNRRTAQVDSISIQPIGGGLSFIINLNEYIKP
ncbi:MAG TPA: hypothetical protein VHB72_02460 [Candidatus Saccharimonadales bacterium]|nr:hypothetical protein [Candidatus Saccharimonadales bacterium]